MDERDVGLMLNGLADTEAPPARIDLGLAMRGGRRRLRWRRAWMGGLLPATAGVVATLVIMTGVPGSVRQPGSAGLSLGGQTVAPMRFDPMVPYASFGWLPAGYPTGLKTSVFSATPQDLGLTVGNADGASISLSVQSKDACHTSGSPSLPVLTCVNSQAIRAVSRAPDVTGRPAFWGLLGMLYLIWQYAPGAWSIMNFMGSAANLPPAATADQQLLRIAAGIRYGLTVPIRFPYWMTGLSAGWTVGNVYYSEPSGVPLADQLTLAAPGGSQRDEISVEPATAGDSCQGGTGQSQRVMLDGAGAVLHTKKFALNGERFLSQMLCAADVQGLRVTVQLQATAKLGGGQTSGESSLGGALTIAQRLHLLGTNPADWTTSPLR
jgi:hypothetical protein